MRRGTGMDRPSSGGIFGERSVRIWTVLGGIAAVVSLSWVLYRAYEGQRHTGHAGSEHSPSKSTPTARTPQNVLPSPDNVWVAQLASVPVSAGSAQLYQVLSAVRRNVPQARYLYSSDYKSLRAGYWMIYYRGPFNNGNQALVFCASHGRPTSEQCVGRFLSTNTPEGRYICLPPAGSQTKGCYHDPHPTPAAEKSTRLRRRTW